MNSMATSVESHTTVGTVTRVAGPTVFVWGAVEYGVDPGLVYWASQWDIRELRLVRRTWGGASSLSELPARMTSGHYNASFDAVSRFFG